MNVRIMQYNEVDAKDWNNFVYANSMGYAYHLYEVVALDRWINDKNISFAIYDDDKNEIVLIVQLHIEEKNKSEEIYYRLHSRWGFVVKDGLSKKELRKVQNGFRGYIDRLYSEYDIQSYDIAMPPLTEYMSPTQHMLVNPVIFWGFAPSVRYTYIVDLKQSEDVLLRSCEETTRQAIRKLRASQKYEFVEAKSTEEDYRIYYKMHVDTYIRSHAEHAIVYEEYFRNIFFNLIEKGVCKVYFLKNNATNEIVASTVILIYKNTAYYWWGASVDNKEIGINKYLVFLSMIAIRNQNIDKYEEIWFEMGGAYPYARGGKAKGLNDFKKCFGGQLHPIYTGDYYI